MNKKRIIIGTITILILSFLFHSVYDKYPSSITSLFFPVNESIWEHNKMILLSFFAWSIVEKIVFRTGKSTFLMNLISTLICIIILDVTFTPVYLYLLNTKENLLITLVFYAISIILGLILSEKFIIEYDRRIETYSLFGFIIISIIFMILTYYPPKLAIFYDYSAHYYGIGEK